MADLKIYEEKMNKSISVLEADLATLRAGRANPSILNKISVEYYGVSTPLAQIGNLSVPDPRTLLIQPWDASVLKEVEKAILASDIGITPNNDGKSVRLNFPPLTEERRKELVKGIKKKGEDSKVAVRSIRRDAMDAFKLDKKKLFCSDIPSVFHGYLQKIFQ